MKKEKTNSRKAIQQPLRFSRLDQGSGLSDRPKLQYIKDIQDWLTEEYNFCLKKKYFLSFAAQFCDAGCNTWLFPHTVKSKIAVDVFLTDLLMRSSRPPLILSISPRLSWVDRLSPSSFLRLFSSSLHWRRSCSSWYSNWTQAMLQEGENMGFSDHNVMQLSDV